MLLTTSKELKMIQFKSMPKFNSINAFFIIIGLLLLWAAVSCTQSTLQYLSEAVYSKGTVIDFSVSTSRDSEGDDITIYSPIVEFETFDNEVISFKSNIGISSKIYEIGETVTVVYLLDAPEEAKIKGTLTLWLGTLIFGCLSTVFFALGFIELLMNVLAVIKGRILMLTGKKIKADLVSIYRVADITVRGENPYRIYVQSNLDGSAKPRKFSTKNIWFDPTPYIHEHVFSVYVSKLKPSRYYVDISFLSKKTTRTLA